MNLKTNSDRFEVTFHTFGCKVNTYDTGLLQKRFQAAAIPLTEPKAVTGRPRVHVLNTCAVTAEATREAAKLVRRIKSREPFSTVVVTGCGAQVDGEVFDTLPGADLVVANSHKGDLENLLDQHFKGTLTSRVFRSNIFRKADLEAGGGVEERHTRAFLKIQDGCNSFCTYCVIPFARGRSRSVPIKDLVRRVDELRAENAQVGEVVLTGVHIGDYEDEVGAQKQGLADLVAAVLEKSSVPRIRLSSLEPVELTPELLKLYSNSRLCPHFHMSIQSANTRVLEAMRRNYGALEVEVALRAIAEQVPGAFVGMDVIAGFPGETEEEFADTYERLASLPWTRLHVFPYSERPGTKAAAYDERLTREVKALRAQRLRDLSSARFAEQARLQIGTVKLGMLLKKREIEETGMTEFLTRDYWPVRVHLSAEARERLQAGSESLIRVIGFDESIASRMDGVLFGELMEVQ